MSSFRFNFVEGFAVQVFALCLVIMALFSCQRSYVPKPNSYYRIDFPDKEYQLYDSICPLTFEYPVYGTLTHLTPPSSDSCWLNIIFPRYKGTIHLTYRKVDNDFDQLIENEWDIVYKKIAQKADAVEEKLIYNNSEENVYGTMYDISGNAASHVLFFVTDSVKNWLRGSLYFYARPNQDSLAPVVAFFREDIIVLMESVRWKDGNYKSSLKKSYRGIVK